MRNSRSAYVLALIFIVVILSSYYYINAHSTDRSNHIESPSRTSFVDQNISDELSPDDIVQENEIINKPPFSVHSEINNIIVKFPNGKIERFTNCSKCKIPVHFKVAAIYENPPALILTYHAYFEEFYVKLYLPTGESIDIGDMPHFSPSNNRFAIVNYSDAFSFDGWAIWERSGDTYEKLDTSTDDPYPAQREGYFFVKWIDEFNIAINVETYNEQNTYCTPAVLKQANFDNPRNWSLIISEELKQEISCNQLQ